MTHCETAFSVSLSSGSLPASSENSNAFKQDTGNRYNNERQKVIFLPTSDDYFWIKKQLLDPHSKKIMILNQSLLLDQKAQFWIKNQVQSKKPYNTFRYKTCLDTMIDKVKQNGYQIDHAGLLFSCFFGSCRLSPQVKSISKPMITSLLWLH